MRTPEQQLGLVAERLAAGDRTWLDAAADLARSVAERAGRDPVEVFRAALLAALHRGVDPLVIDGVAVERRPADVVDLTGYRPA